VVFAERRQWGEAAPYALSFLAHAALIIAASWDLTKAIVLKNESAVAVEIIDRKAYDSAVERPVVAPNPSPLPMGSSVDHDKPTASPIDRPHQPESNWRRSETLLSAAEISDPKHKRLKAKLDQLESGTRTIQICNLEAILQITRSEVQFHPTMVVAYATQDVVATDELLTANGAAFESEGNWYHLSYRCRIAPRSSTVQGFEFAIGKAIPAKDWEADSLPPHPVSLADD
jgi:hypothetical protein